MALLVSAIIYLLVLLVSVILHEMGHALAALLLGDDTAKKQKRFYIHTHFDFFGSFVLPLLSYCAGFPFLIAYAKPVPVDIRKFKDPLLDFALVGLAGPAVNLLLAILAMVLWNVMGHPTEGVLADVLIVMSFTNLGLFFFNLIPVPPLDGSRILLYLLPHNLAIKYGKLERFGILVIILLEYLSIGLSRVTGVDCDLFHIFVWFPIKYIFQLYGVGF